MMLNEYQEKSKRTIPEGLSVRESMLNAALGICGEAGECADAIKKWQYQGHPYPNKNIIEELGDVMFYVAMMATSAGVSLEDVASKNIGKLKARYPDKFDPERSINR